MELKIKKIIAREGLVIISILILSGALIFASNWYDDKKNDLEDYGNIWKGKDSKTGIVYVLPSTKENLEKRLEEAAANTTEANKEDWIQQKYGKEMETIRARIKYAQYSDYTKTSFFFSLFALYPFYLLIRFVLWAVFTLRK